MKSGTQSTFTVADAKTRDAKYRIILIWRNYRKNR